MGTKRKGTARMDRTKMDKKAILTWIDENRASFEALALEIWGAPELAYQEHEVY